MVDAWCFYHAREVLMSDEKRPSEEKELQDSELDNVSGGTVGGYAFRNPGISPEHGGGIDPGVVKKGPIP